jgi:hypothetical protein
MRSSAPTFSGVGRRRAGAMLLAAALAMPCGAFAQDKPAADGAQEAGIRMMLKVQIPVEAGNDAVKTGMQGKVFEDLMNRIHPEAAYFSQEDGLRTAYFVYVIHDTAEFAAIHEPLIQGLGATVYDQPALTWDELKQGFGAIDEKP